MNTPAPLADDLGAVERMGSARVLKAKPDAPGRWHASRRDGAESLMDVTFERDGKEFFVRLLWYPGNIKVCLDYAIRGGWTFWEQLEQNNQPVGP